MKLRTGCLLMVFSVCVAARQAPGQEAQPPSAPGTAGAKDAAASGPEKKYEELTHSKDSKVKGTAERYLNLVRFQEWGGATGKTQMAKYVSHDPGLKQVRLSVARGTGKDRVVKDFDVEVDKLNKTCQARVKQIDVLQKKLDEMLANGADKPEALAGQPGSEGPGGATNNRYARNRRGAGAEGSAREHMAAAAGPEAAAPAANVAAPQTTSPESDPSASEPDPIGFAELPPVTPPGPAVGPGGIPVGPGGVPAGPGAAPEVRPQNPAASPSGNTGTLNSRDKLKAAYVAAFEAGDKAMLEKLI